MRIYFTEEARAQGIDAALLLASVGRTVKVTKRHGVAIITGEIVGLNLREWELQVREHDRTWPIPIRDIMEVEFQ